MDNQKMYTAQELRQTAEMDFYVTKLGLDDGPNLTDEIRSMLRHRRRRRGGIGRASRPG